MYSRLIFLLDKHNILSQCQLGFRKGKSTEHTLIKFIDFITPCLDDKKSILAFSCILTRRLIQ